jgi:hypothetical protein
MAAAARSFADRDAVEVEPGFALVPKVIPVCGHCGHKTARHCKGGETHSDWRGPGVTTCVGRHCMEPLCCCVECVE